MNTLDYLSANIAEYSGYRVHKSHGSHALFLRALWTRGARGLRTPVRVRKFRVVWNSIVDSSVVSFTTLVLLHYDVHIDPALRYLTQSYVISPVNRNVLETFHHKTQYA